MFICTKIRKAFIFFGGILFVFSVFLSLISAEKAVFVSTTSDKGIFLPVIMYHRIVKDETKVNDYAVSIATFQNDMEYLYSNGYNTINFQDLVNYVYKDISLPEKAVMITFDDGFHNNLLYAVPILEKYNMKAVFSVIGKCTEDFSESNDKNSYYAYLTWDDISEIAKNSNFEIGNHSYDMHSLGKRKGCGKLSSESSDEYCNILKSDISLLQKGLKEHCNIEPNVFAYPYGNICCESISVLKELGFLGTFNCTEKPNYITKSPDTLFGINRYNRPSGISTGQFMKKALLTD